MFKKLRKKIHDSDMNIFVAITAKIVARIIEFLLSFVEAFGFWFDGEIVLRKWENISVTGQNVVQDVMYPEV